MNDCENLSRLKKYRERKSPPYPANKCPLGTQMEGNDGNMYENITASNGIYRWKKISRGIGSKLRRSSKRASRGRPRGSKSKLRRSSKRTSRGRPRGSKSKLRRSSKRTSRGRPRNNIKGKKQTGMPKGAKRPLPSHLRNYVSYADKKETLYLIPLSSKDIKKYRILKKETAWNKVKHKGIDKEEFNRIWKIILDQVSIYDSVKDVLKEF